MKLKFTVNVPSYQESRPLYWYAGLSLGCAATWVLYVLYGWHDLFGAMGFCGFFLMGGEAMIHFMNAQDWLDEKPSRTTRT